MSHDDTRDDVAPLTTPASPTPAHRLDGAPSETPDGLAPLDGLVARLAALLGAEGVDPAHVFDEAFGDAALAAAAQAEEDDALSFQALHRGLKSLKGFPLTTWTAAVKKEAKRQRDGAKAAARVRQCEDAAEQRVRAEAARDAMTAELESERAADPERRHHYADVVRGPHRYAVRPGLVTLTEERVDGRLVTTNLAEFSAVIAEQTLTFESPGAPPDIELRLSVCFGGEGAPRDVNLPAAALESPGWMLRKLGKDGGDTAPRSYEHLRRAVFAASQDVTETHRRYGYIGWVDHGERLVYAHAGGAIGAEGVVADMLATPLGPLKRFALPAPPSGVEAERAIAATLRLLSMEPASVMVPMVALAFHAPLGGSRAAFHATGITDVGKSVRASLVQRFYGRDMHHKAPPGSWSATPAGMYPLLAGAGDALFWIDDLTPSVSPQRVEAILRAHFNESGATRGKREGGMRELPMSRCNLLSVGEVEPRGDTASTLNRIITADLSAQLPPEASDLYALATAGAFDATMALYLRWLAPTIREIRAAARLEEREAALRWGFDLRDRTADLMGTYCLGMEQCLAFLHAHGVPTAAVDYHRARAVEAFAEVSSKHRVRVASDDVGRRLLDLLMDAVAAGRAHVAAIGAVGMPPRRRTMPPADAHAWGYRMEGEEMRPKLDCVGYHLNGKPGVVYLLPGPAVAVASREAKLRGRELGGDVDSLAKALLARDHLAETALHAAAAKITVQIRVADGSQPRAWAVRLESLVGTLDPDTDGGADSIPASATSAPHVGDEPEGFPHDIDPFSPEVSGVPPP